MIGALIAWIRDARIRHYHAAARAAGAATLDAQIRRDWPRASRLMAQMHRAQAKRDALVQQARRAEMRRDAWLHADGETRPPCHHTRRRR